MIEYQRVSYAFKPGEATFLHNLSFRIEQGEWVSIVGRNGCGKSTLVKLMNHLLPKDGGTIKVDEIELEPETIGAIRERIGMVFQNPDNQFVGMTVADDIIFGLENRCLDRETMESRLHEYTEMLNIKHLLDRHPSLLSGGQKQRVAIASALALEPKIIIFDEATSMLDEKGKYDILDIMKTMKASGKYTIVSVTHDHDEIMASDRILAMDDGTLIADDSPLSLFTREELLQACHLRPPFIVQLLKELEARGIKLHQTLDSKEVVEALWSFNLNKSPLNTK